MGVRVKPGDYVMYHTGTDPRPPWPAVIIRNNMIPQKVRERPPVVADVAILLFFKWEVRWVSLSDIHLYTALECMEENEVIGKNPGLQAAYGFLQDGVLGNLPLSHWGHYIGTRSEIDALPSHEPEPAIEPDSDNDQDSDFQRAFRASLVTAIPGTSGKRRAPFEDDSDDEEMPPSSQPKRQKSTPRRSLESLPIRTPSLNGQSSKQQAMHRSCSPGSEQSPMQESNLDEMPSWGFSRDPEIGVAGPSSGAQVRARSEEAPYPTPPEEPEDEEDELMNKQWACWLIGPDSEKFHIPILAIKSRDHLKRMDILKPKGKDGWIVFKPSFEHIDPKKFSPVADFLSSGDFNSPTKGPDGTELDEEAQKFTAIEFYSWAWEVAESLSLHDMMALIVEKVRAVQPLAWFEALAFASTVYSEVACTAFPVEADQEMRRLLVACLKAHFWDLPRDKLENEFPELFRDILLATAEDLQERIDRTE